MPLAPGAIRITDAAATREFAGPLRNVASSQSAACTTSEFLVWEGDVGDQVSGSLATQLTARQLTLKVLEATDTEDSASLSFVLTGREGRHAGVMYAGSNSVVLGWCRLAARPTASVPSGLKPAQAPKPAALATAKTSAPPVGDYSCLNADSLVYAFKLSILPGMKYRCKAVRSGRLP
ncbi:hypothetical protein [Deinococcus deserti]|uniref:hypothetical protein n=1 Tax=Deinococcus deserti TaxID=310783 RepID=UPI0013922182|nr:hypothetical protein [Deinococcus deserti]